MGGQRAHHTGHPPALVPLVVTLAERHTISPGVEEWIVKAADGRILLTVHYDSIQCALIVKSRTEVPYGIDTDRPEALHELNAMIMALQEALIQMVAWEARAW